MDRKKKRLVQASLSKPHTSKKKRKPKRGKTVGDVFERFMESQKLVLGKKRPRDS